MDTNDEMQYHSLIKKFKRVNYLKKWKFDENFEECKLFEEMKNLMKNFEDSKLFEKMKNLMKKFKNVNYLKKWNI